MQRHFPPTLHHFSPVILATATVVRFVRLCNSRFKYHNYTQCKPTPTQKPARKWQLQQFLDFLRERLRRAFTRANQLRWTAQQPVSGALQPVRPDFGQRDFQCLFDDERPWRTGRGRDGRRPGNGIYWLATRGALRPVRQDFDQQHLQCSIDEAKPWRNGR